MKMIDVSGNALPTQLKGPQDLLATRNEELPAGELFVVFNVASIQVFGRMSREVLDQSFSKDEADWIAENGWEIGCSVAGEEITKSVNGGFAVISEAYPVRKGPRL